MAEFAADPRRVDPYKNFTFRLKWDGKYVAGVSKVSPLKRTTEVVEHRQGGDSSAPHKSPGRTKYEAITLERGVTRDHAFEQWANEVSALRADLGDDARVVDFRKDVTLELCDAAGELAVAYRIFGCWVSEYEAVSDLVGDGAAIERIRLENEGWERETSDAEPSKQDFSA